MHDPHFVVQAGVATLRPRTWSVSVVSEPDRVILVS